MGWQSAPCLPCAIPKSYEREPVAYLVFDLFVRLVVGLLQDQCFEHEHHIQRLGSRRAFPFLLVQSRRPVRNAYQLTADFSTSRGPRISASLSCRSAKSKNPSCPFHGFFHSWHPWLLNILCWVSVMPILRFLMTGWAIIRGANKIFCIDNVWTDQPWQGRYSSLECAVFLWAVTAQWVLGVVAAVLFVVITSKIEESLGYKANANY